MEPAAKLFEEAMRLPEDEREELAARLLDSLEPPPGISVEDTDELERRAAEARSGAPGIGWEELKRDLEVIDFERRAWLADILASPGGPDVERYLARRIDTEI